MPNNTNVTGGRCAKCGRIWGDHLHPWVQAKRGGCKFVPQAPGTPYELEQSATEAARVREEHFHTQMSRFM
jgi:hypothetical protein